MIVRDRIINVDPSHAIATGYYYSNLQDALNYLKNKQVHNVTIQITGPYTINTDINVEGIGSTNPSDLTIQGDPRTYIGIVYMQSSILNQMGNCQNHADAGDQNALYTLAGAGFGITVAALAGLSPDFNTLVYGPASGEDYVFVSPNIFTAVDVCAGNIIWTLVAPGALNSDASYIILMGNVVTLNGDWTIRSPCTIRGISLRQTTIENTTVDINNSTILGTGYALTIRNSTLISGYGAESYCCTNCQLTIDNSILRLGSGFAFLHNGLTLSNSKLYAPSYLRVYASSVNNSIMQVTDSEVITFDARLSGNLANNTGVTSVRSKIDLSSCSMDIAGPLAIGPTTCGIRASGSSEITGDTISIYDSNDGVEINDCSLLESDVAFTTVTVPFPLFTNPYGIDNIKLGNYHYGGNIIGALTNGNPPNTNLYSGDSFVSTIIFDAGDNYNITGAGGDGYALQICTFPLGYLSIDSVTVSITLNDDSALGGTPLLGIGTTGCTGGGGGDHPINMTVYDDILSGQVIPANITTNPNVRRHEQPRVMFHDATAVALSLYLNVSDVWVGAGGNPDFHVTGYLKVSWKFASPL